MCASKKACSKSKVNFGKGKMALARCYSNSKSVAAIKNIAMSRLIYLMR